MGSSPVDHLGRSIHGPLHAHNRISLCKWRFQDDGREVDYYFYDLHLHDCILYNLGGSPEGQIHCQTVEKDAHCLLPGPIVVHH